MRRAALLILTASLAFGQEERWFITPGTDANPGKQTRTAMLKAACEGDVNGNSCSRCPGSDQGPWTISSLVMGHFGSAQSDEAFAGVSSCYYPGNGNPLGLLLGKRDGEWTKLEDILAFDPHRCTRRKFRSGREFLICEGYEYSQNGERAYSLSSLIVENGQARFHTLFQAADTTHACQVENGRHAEVHKIEFRDLNGDGLEDISIAASYESFAMTGRRKQQCETAEEDRIQSDGKPTKGFPRAPGKTYTIDLLFDGNRYTPTPQSRAALALFPAER